MNQDYEDICCFSVENFMRDQELSVHIGTTIPDNFIQAMGVLQGNIISKTIFSLKLTV